MSEYLSDHVHLGDDLTSVVILDQTLLPNEVKYLTLRAPEEMFEAIQSLRVRGPRPSASAPATAWPRWPSSGKACRRTDFAPNSTGCPPASTPPAPRR